MNLRILRMFEGTFLLDAEHFFCISDLYLSSAKAKHKSRQSEGYSHFGVIITLFFFIAALIWMNISVAEYNESAFAEYGDRVAWLLYFIVMTPYLSLPVAFAACIGLMLFNPYKNPPEPDFSLSSAPFICFRVVSRGDYPAFVKSNVQYNQHLCQKLGLENFVIEVVTDRSIYLPLNQRTREIVVPSGYQTKRNTLFKARALNYCLENEVNRLSSNDWIVHLDEETILTKAALYGILDFIANDMGDIGQGPISYANAAHIPCWSTTMADCIRLAFDYAIFRFQLSVLKRPVFGFKGSYIVMRHRVEKAIGFDLGPKGSIAEDCFFALKAWSRGYIFEFIQGEMKENSPFTVMDYIRQRRRWFVGQLYTVLSRDIPLPYKLGIMLSITCSILVPVSLSNIALNILFPVYKPLAMKVLTGFIGGVFTFLYAFGAFKSLSGRGWSYKYLSFICLLNCVFVAPLASLAESMAVYWGIVTLNAKSFFVVKKDMNMNEHLH